MSLQLSYELFPPKQDADKENIMSAAERLANLCPDFASVTFGAGGSRSGYTVELCDYVQNVCKLPTVAHMTCYGLSSELVDRVAAALIEKGIGRVLVLRGDYPRDSQPFTEFENALALTRYIAGKYPEFEIYTAAYPEGHPEFAASGLDEAAYVAEKVKSGARHIVTQMFFENEHYYRLRERLAQLGVDVPLHAGIMPVTSLAQVSRMAAICARELPRRLIESVESRADDHSRRLAGLEWAARQVRELAQNGADGIHLYTMNSFNTAKYITDEIRGN